MKGLFSFIFALMAIVAFAEERVCFGRVFPERNDDFAWENDLVAFRAYGPETQRRGEKAFGYDIFLKYPDKGLVLEKLYGEQCSPKNWHKVDSLKKINPLLAEKFEESFTYHIDHGLGLDCYAVGPTLGAGTAAIINGDSICYPWSYDKVEILENSPYRIQFKLTFAPRTIDCDKNVVETRIITLNAGEHLCHCLVKYDGLTKPYDICVGLRWKGPNLEVVRWEGKNHIQGTEDLGENGKVRLVAILPNGMKEERYIEGQSLGIAEINPGEAFEYYFGFAWSKSDIQTSEQWTNYLGKFGAR